MNDKISMIEAATEIITAASEPMKFADLWQKVKEACAISAEEEASRIGHFYTDLSLSGNLLCLANNTWDLKSRHKYSPDDVSEVYQDMEESADLSETDIKENEDYDKSVGGQPTIQSSDWDSPDEAEEKGEGDFNSYSSEQNNE